MLPYRIQNKKGCQDPFFIGFSKQNELFFPPLLPPKSFWRIFHVWLFLRFLLLYRWYDSAEIRSKRVTALFGKRRLPIKRSLALPIERFFFHNDRDYL